MIIDRAGHPMWVFRYVRDGRFEEIHATRNPNDPELCDAREARRRARALATEVNGPVMFTQAWISATIDTVHRTYWGDALWQVAMPPRTPGAAETSWVIVECPNMDQHQARP